MAHIVVYGTTEGVANVKSAMNTNAAATSATSAATSAATTTTTVSVIAARFSRRALLSAVVVAPALTALLAACGDNTKGAGSNPPDTTSRSNPPGTDTTDNTAPSPGTGSGIEYPTGAGDVIVRLGYVGGFVPQGYAFTNVPSLLITGDGRAFTPGITTAIFPGPLLPAINVRTITEAGVQTVLATTAAAGLLQTPPDYTLVNDNIADASIAQLVLTAAGGTFTHEAYALGLEDPAETKARNVLQGVVIQLGDLEKLVGVQDLGADAPFAAEAYRLQAYPMTAESLAGYTDEPKPTIVPWPTTTGIELAAATDCATVTAAAAATVFSDANQLTFFSENDVVYSIAVVAMLPGDTC